MVKQKIYQSGKVYLLCHNQSFCLSYIYSKAFSLKYSDKTLHSLITHSIPNIVSAYLFQCNSTRKVE